MRPPLKLSAIDQEHLQELYDTAGVARDELPYTEVFTSLCEGFQDRTFKNAHPEQVYGALLKYVRSSGNSATEQPASTLNEDQAKQLKAVLSRHMIGGKLSPYSSEFESARAEFNRLSGMSLEEYEFWRSIQRSQGNKRKPPPRKKVAVARDDDDDID